MGPEALCFRVVRLCVRNGLLLRTVHSPTGLPSSSSFSSNNRMDRINFGQHQPILQVTVYELSVKPEQSGGHPLPEKFFIEFA